MRAGLVLAGLAASSFALPQMKKRDMVVVWETETDVVWVTALVTVTASPVEAFVAAATPTTTSSAVIEPASGARKHHDVNAWTWEGHSTSYVVVASPTRTTRGPWKHTSSAAPAPVVTTTVVIPPVEPSTEARTTPTTSVTPEAQPTTTTTPAPQPTTTTTTPQAQPTTAEAPKAQTTTAAYAAKPTTYEQLVVAHHNVHRRNHSAPDLVWSSTLANTAAKIAASCDYNHNTDMDTGVIGGYGQNIAAGVGANNVSLIITELFYNNEVNWYNASYGQAAPDMKEFHHWGHFSQIVWGNTTKVGCATHECAVLKNVADNVPPIFTVCNYQDAGNMGGGYGYLNVGEPLGYPTVHWDYFN